MSETSSPDWSGIVAASKRFERCWNEGARPRIEDFLEGVPEPHWLPLLVELIRIECELRQRGADEPTAEEYRRRFPIHDEVVASLFDSGRTALVANGEPLLRPRGAGSTKASSIATPPPAELANHPDYQIIRQLG